jgi:hypothetical protein
MRHGEPEIYGEKNSGLSIKGKNQVIEAVNNILKSFIDDEPQQVKIIYSDRKRTIETSKILQKEFEKLRKNENLNRVKVLKPLPSRLMKTADSLNSIVNLGYPLKNAYKIWVNLPDDILKSWGIQSPEEIRESVINYIVQQHNISKKSGNNGNTNIIGVTHETTLLAFQIKLFPMSRYRPRYAEFMRIYFKKNKPIICFRGKETFLR